MARVNSYPERLSPEGTDLFYTESTAPESFRIPLSRIRSQVTTAINSAVGGTANAITLTTGAGITGTPPTGLRLWFRASSANTGATTIALDGGTPIACRTVTGVALPSGYIRTDVDTEAYFDGTHWILKREIQRGSNANGEFVRFADGTQIVVQPFTYNFGDNRGLRTGSNTFPAAFSELPVLAGVSVVPPVAAAAANASRLAAFLAMDRDTTAAVGRIISPTDAGNVWENLGIDSDHTDWRAVWVGRWF